MKPESLFSIRRQIANGTGLKERGIGAAIREFYRTPPEDRPAFVASLFSISMNQVEATTGVQPEYIPSPDEIRVRSAFQRMSWSQNEYYSRAVRKQHGEKPKPKPTLEQIQKRRAWMREYYRLYGKGIRRRAKRTEGGVAHG